MVSSFIATFMHIPLCLLFVFYFDLDIRGLALASSVKDFIALLSVMIYANCSE